MQLGSYPVYVHISSEAQSGSLGPIALARSIWGMDET